MALNSGSQFIINPTCVTAVKHYDMRDDIRLQPQTQGTNMGIILFVVMKSWIVAVEPLPALLEVERMNENTDFCLFFFLSWK